MTIAYWCVLAAGLLPYLAITIAKWDKTYLRGNAAPREWEAKLQGAQSRAHAAHLNGFEAFPLFAAGVLIAAACKAPQATVDGIAIGFIVARLAYIACYVGNLATLRSLVWMVGMGLSIALYFIAASVR
ncbi:MAG: MAPEG family protein [Betaproteobacteria bacterium]|nr:MAPEG family protein [Betaproteobacteria bacterium]